MKMKIQRLKAKYRYSLILLKQIVITDFKLRYQGSILGYLWTLLRPLAFFLILYTVFVKFLRIGSDIPHFPVYLLLGIVLWTYFAEVTTGGIASIVSKGDILRKLAFPRYVIVVSGSVSALINLTINLGVVGVFMIIDGVSLRPTIFLAIFPILELFALALAIAFLLSALFVRLRDITHIWEVVMQGLFYATPIIYPVSMVISNTSDKVAKVLLLNPLAQIIQDTRYFAITSQTETTGSIYGNEFMRIIPISIVISLLIVSSWYFRKRSPYFAEEL